MLHVQTYTYRMVYLDISTFDLNNPQPLTETNLTHFQSHFLHMFIDFVLHDDFETLQQSGL